ncbi:MAG TPA: fumarylacetoacetate hydrolase family protein [Bacteroidota bacterium]|nr:fumarylacetoacetate hydrolase family protein [Bacteroidota bacterium]
MSTALLTPSQAELRINTIFCLGQNYAEHAKEMGSAAPTTPVIFLKPNAAVIANNEDIIIPAHSSNIHHEVELTVLIGKGGKQIPRERALDHVAGYGIGLDMTMRDRQLEAKKAGLPWTIAKGFDTSAPLSPFVDSRMVADPHALEIQLSVNGELRQHSNTRNMIFRIDAIIAFLSGIITLTEGDVIYTGTPEGVARVVSGDVIDASIAGIGALHHRVV